MLHANDIYTHNNSKRISNLVSEALKPKKQNLDFSIKKETITSITNHMVTASIVFQSPIVIARMPGLQN